MTRLRTWLLRTIVFGASTALALVLAELVYRRAAPSPATFVCRDAERRVVGMDRLGEAHLFAPNPHVPPGRSHRNAPAPGARFYLCYENPVWSYFDAQGCVENRINALGVRDREELCAPKAPGERRLLCIGDSFTFGWGVPVEDCWVRLVEGALRARDDRVRTVNGGIASGLFADEYALALRDRLGPDFDPDAVLVTLCLNDLLPTTDVLSHRDSLPIPWIYRNSRLARDLFAADVQRRRLATDPEDDLVARLLALPAEYYSYFPWARDSGVGHADFWAGGGPQRALLAMRGWCAARGIAFGVVIWPHMQGLGPGEHYPFATIHRLVGEFCSEHGIAFHDVLPALRGRRPTPELWVHPADLHPNHLANALAAPGIAALARGLLGL